MLLPSPISTRPRLHHSLIDAPLLASISTHPRLYNLHVHLYNPLSASLTHTGVRARIQVVAVVVLTADDPTLAISSNEGLTLASFQQWQADRRTSLGLVDTDAAYWDVAVLITGVDFVGATVGLASLGAVWCVM